MAALNGNMRANGAGIQRQLLTLLLAAQGLAAPPSPQVSIADRQVLVHGQPFRMQGVCYQPTPVGQSATLPPFGDYFTADHKALYNRDLPLMRAMGANTVRVYNWDANANHDDFLNSAWNNGVQPLQVLINAYIEPTTDWANPNVVNQLKSRWRTLASKVADHPAVIGFLIGNELNARSASQLTFWTAINDLAGTVRAVAPNQLVTSPLADDSLITIIRTNDTRMTQFNCWAAQLYRGRSFGSLFSQYETVSAKPLLVTEFGMDAYDRRTRAEYANGATLTADYLRSLWLEIARRTNSVCGGLIFEWSDEWWKDQATGTSFSAHDTGGWSVPGFPDGTAEHEWWGVFRAPATLAGRLEPRAAFAVFQELWAAPSTRLIEPVVGGDGIFEATVDGPAGLRFQVEVSNDLEIWRSLVTNQLPFRFRDASSQPEPKRTYRAIEVR